MEKKYVPGSQQASLEYEYQQSFTIPQSSCELEESVMSIERPNLDDWEPPEEIRVPPSLRDPRIHVTRQGLPLSGVILPSLCPMSPADTAGLLVQQHILLLTTRHSYPQAWSCPCPPFFGDSQHPLACNRLGKNVVPFPTLHPSHKGYPSTKNDPNTVWRSLQSSFPQSSS